MSLNLGDPFPNFTADTTIGSIDFHQWMGDSWAILFSHPADYTPVCTTELAAVAKLIPEFAKRNVKPIALSCDSVASHRGWIEDIKAYGGLQQESSGGGASGDGAFPFPIIDDAKRELAVKLNMLDRDEIGAAGLPLTCRAVFVIDPSKKLRLLILYPATTGRNFGEILRTIDSMQLTDKRKVATPADWKQGESCMVLPTVKDEQLSELFPAGVTSVSLPSGKGYLRRTECPK
ncbi:peroxiredoxin-6 [Anopheles aquasalis]|uniref:peroxiredoxin-6 n=1 Tax=Anopheles aquasalis TaxID=42839 RepID=UPI00215AB13F|nr:peroxiredoxin-6 [Anopheles aquasalis]